MGGTGHPAPFCRCGWTLLRTEDSADELLITPAPVQPAKVYSFGAPASPGAIGPQFPSKEKKLPSSWAEALDNALAKKDGGAQARLQLRSLFADDGLTSKDVERELPGANKIKIIAAKGANFHDWDGTIGVDKLTYNRAHRASRKLAKGEQLTDDELGALQTLIHEELHGTSIISKEAYEGGLGVSLEEASTELLARRYTGRLAGQFNQANYQSEIDGLVAVVRKSTKITEAEALNRITDAAARIRNLTDLQISDAAVNAELFVGELKATEAQRKAILKRLETEKWWEPGAAEKILKPGKSKAAPVEKPVKVAKPKAPTKAQLAAEAKAKKLAEAEAKKQAAAIAKETAKLAKEQAKAEAAAAKLAAKEEAKFAKLKAAEEKKAAAALAKASKQGAKKKPPVANNLLAEKVSGAKGSNEGGIYRGTDGKERYVKFYDDKSQAHIEHLSNQIYSALGIGSPKSVVFENNGKLAYASELIPGVKTLADHGVSKGLADKALEGFAADVLTANWDAAGLGLDNMVVDGAGNIIRIDNGGSLLFRAKAGRKSDNALLNVTEWQSFFNQGINPGYSRLAQAAGATRAEDLGKSLAAGIKKVAALEKKSGGWAAFVEKHAAGLNAADKAKVVEALTARSGFLRSKLAEIEAHADSLTKAKRSAASLKRVADDELQRTVQQEPIMAARTAPYLSSHPNYQAVRDYTGNDYKRVNAALRAPETFSPKERAKLLRTADQATTALRDAEASGFAYKGAVLRGERRDRLPDDVWEIYKTTDIGGTLEFPAFLSTTSSTLVQESFSHDSGVLMKIRQYSGIAVDKVSMNQGEHEILLPPGSRFRLIHREVLPGNRIVLELEQVQ